ncbi:MAG: ribosome recycling factor [Deltaproteobacteria bacterium]|nr:ribosome recycling factor [Deltaproteobacteria bacterium]MCX7953222.1 ribosome recycling factor [Deltaproteobacteria bacterium]
MESDAIKNLKQKCLRAEEHLVSTLKKLRTGRANSSLIEDIFVNYYGVQTPLKQIAHISVLDARTLSVQVFDAQVAPEVDNALRASNLGLNPQREGSVIRIPLPPMTEERRKELIKKAAQIVEEIKVEIRRFRKEALDEIRQAIAAEDERKRLEKEVQKIIDEFENRFEEKLKQKEKEILEV